MCEELPEEKLIRKKRRAAYMREYRKIEYVKRKQSEYNRSRSRKGEVK
jgi:hypothetical protein